MVYTCPHCTVYIFATALIHLWAGADMIEEDFTHKRELLKTENVLKV